ncbi:DUF5334 family protein [Neorhizobium sp. NPDC001467]|uniref:DUF5334 family protein n=1 Tax=Neorhizobium sp. NPDC001467 TaxID=3390595 RepID=UPI003CFC3120
MKTIAVLVTLAALLFGTQTMAWDGVDAESGANVEIGKGNLVREGETIEVYDYDAGEYRDMEVQSIDSSGSSVDLEVYDNESGETRTFNMEDN